MRRRHRRPGDVGGTPSGRRVLKVGPDQPLQRPSDAARVAQDNDIIEIEAGRYVGDVALWTQNGLLLRGVNGRPHLDSQGRTAQDQGIWVFRGNDIVVENIEFSGARARSRNGSGIRFFGRNLTVRDSYFHDNEDGVLTYTAPDGDVLIERSVFAHNGAGDGQSHNIYIGKVRSFTLRFSHSHDSVRGSRSEEPRAHQPHRVQPPDRRGRRQLELRHRPAGRRLRVRGRQRAGEGRARRESERDLLRRREAPRRHGRRPVGGQQHVLQPASSTRPSSPIAASCRRSSSTTCCAARPSVLLDGPGTDRNNSASPASGLVDAGRIRFPTDRRLAADRCGRGSRQRRTPCALWPQFEYVHPAAAARASDVAALDSGAYEFCGGEQGGKMALPRGFEPRFKP